MKKIFSSASFLTVLIMVLLIVAIALVFVACSGDKVTLTPADENLERILSIVLDGDQPSGNGITNKNDFETIVEYVSSYHGKNAPLDSEDNYQLHVDWPVLYLYSTKSNKTVGDPLLENVDNYDANTWVNRNGKLTSLNNEDSNQQFALLGGKTVVIDDNGDCSLWSYGTKLYSMGQFYDFIDDEFMAIFLSGNTLNYCNGSVFQSLQFPVKEISSIADGKLSGIVEILDPQSSSDTGNIVLKDVPCILTWDSGQNAFSEMQATFSLTSN